jgi:hypothetical protein
MASKKKMTAYEEAMSRNGGNLDPNDPADAQIIADDIADTATFIPGLGGVLGMGASAAKNIAALGKKYIPSIVKAAGYAKGGTVKSCDGIAKRGKTKGRMR